MLVVPECKPCSFRITSAVSTNDGKFRLRNGIAVVAGIVVALFSAAQAYAGTIAFPSNGVGTLVVNPSPASFTIPRDYATSSSVPGQNWGSAPGINGSGITCGVNR